MTKYLIGAIGGSILGYFVLYRLIGCSTRACSITANPFIATLYGLVLGLLIAGLFTSPKKADDLDL